MKLKRGGRVKFLNDTGGGVVTNIVDDKMAIVLNDDGFEVPYLISELITLTGSSGNDASAIEDERISGIPLQENEEKQIIPDKKVAGEGHNKVGDDYEYTCTDVNSVVSADQPFAHEKQALQKPERNLLVGLVESRSKESLEVWLINDSGFNVFYLVLQRDELSYLNIRTGYIEPDTKILIRQFSREQINSFITLRLQALFFLKGLFDPVSPSQTELNLDPVRIYSDGAFCDNDFFDENAMIIPVISDLHEREIQKIREQEVSRLIAQKKDIPQAAGTNGIKPDRQKTDPLVEEVDLHIEVLVENHSGLSGREVLDLQMARFTTALEGALRGKTRRIVFIHGVGNGKLKFEIRKTLDKKYSRLRYQDASFQEYGYGATMVIIRK